MLSKNFVYVHFKIINAQRGLLKNAVCIQCGVHAISVLDDL